MNKTIITLGLLFAAVLAGCKSSSSDNTTKLAAAAFLISRSSASTGTFVTGSSCNSNTSTGLTISFSTASIDSSTGCVSGVSSCMDSALPAWIQNNFKCAVGYVSGSSYVLKSQNLPNTKSSYYGTTSSLYEARTSTGTNPNSTSSQKLVYTIPTNPSKGTGTVSTQGGLVSIGITVNGLAIFNNAAAPPDNLSVEALTFDNFQGHPQNSGVYHHQAAVPKICDGTSNTSNSGSCNNSSLIGVLVDGYGSMAKNAIMQHLQQPMILHQLI